MDMYCNMIEGELVHHSVACDVLSCTSMMSCDCQRKVTTCDNMSFVCLHASGIQLTHAHMQYVYGCVVRACTCAFVSFFVHNVSGPVFFLAMHVRWTPYHITYIYMIINLKHAPNKYHGNTVHASGIYKSIERFVDCLEKPSGFLSQMGVSQIRGYPKIIPNINSVY